MCNVFVNLKALVVWRGHLGHDDIRLNELEGANLEPKEVGIWMIRLVVVGLEGGIVVARARDLPDVRSTTIS